MQQSTKAQIQIGETIAVILIFMILMIFGLYWFASASFASNQQAALQQDRTDLLEATKNVMNLPELHCSTAGVIDTNCVDIYRLQAVQQTIQGTHKDEAVYELYGQRFVGSSRGAYKLEIETFFPGNRSSIIVFDFTQDNTLASEQQAAIPVIVYDPITNIKQFGVAKLTHQVIA